MAAEHNGGTNSSGASSSTEARRKGRMGALRAVGVATAFPWQVALPGQPMDVDALLRVAAPTTAAAGRRASLRFPAVGLLFTVVMDLAVAQLLGGGGPWLTVRTALAAATGLMGLVVGRSAGRLRALTGLFSVVLAGTQLVALAQAPLGSHELIALLTIASSILCAVTSAWHALRS